jgi:hypothetical protein
VSRSENPWKIKYSKSHGHRMKSFHVILIWHRAVVVKELLRIKSHSQAETDSLSICHETP